jgi:integrase/recombinase XerC
MPSELVPASDQAGLPALPAVEPNHVYAALLADAKKPATKKAREQDIDALSRFLGIVGLEQVPAEERTCTLIVMGESGPANAIAIAWIKSMLEAKLAPSTINRRISTLRRLVKIARVMGLVDWSIEAESLKVESYRDTTGPGLGGWRRILNVAKRDAARSAKGKRDLAIILLLHDRGLRRGEVASLDLEDWDPEAGRVMVQRKRKSQKAPKTVNEPTAFALCRWVEVRGKDPGPLFTRLDRGRPDRERPLRLGDDFIYDIVAELGRRAHVNKGARPHGLRHQGITRVAELSGGNVLMAQLFADHSDPKTTQKYFDNLKDLGGEATKLLGGDA